MNSQILDDNEFEVDLAAHLRGRADLAPTTGEHGWSGIERHLAIRRRRRQATRGGALTLGLTMVVGAAVMLSGPGKSDDQRVASGSTTGGPLRLTLDAPWLSPVHVESYEPGPIAPPVTPRVFVDPEVGLAGSAAFVVEVPLGARFGFGEMNPGATEIDVVGQTGYLGHNTPIASTLGWQLPAESGLQGLYVGALRMADDEIVQFARALVVADGQVSLGDETIGPLAESDLLGVVSSPGAKQEFAEISYEGPNHGAALRVHHGADRGSLADLVLDRVLSARDVETVEVRGATGVLITYEGVGEDRSLMWSDRFGTVIELTYRGALPTDGVEDLIASLQEITEDEWAALVDELGDARPPDTTIIGPPDPLSLHLLHLCHLRDQWLSTPDTARRAAIVEDVVAAYESARNAGLGDASDVLVVHERLIQAMTDGDTAQVVSIAEGGCPPTSSGTNTGGP